MTQIKRSLTQVIICVKNSTSSIYLSFAISVSDLVDGLLLNYETGVGKGTDIISTQGGFNFNKLALNGSVTTLNAVSKGNVGIGTDTPFTKLDVESQNSEVMRFAHPMGQLYFTGHTENPQLLMLTLGLD